jgi:hypothetical protein
MRRPPYAKSLEIAHDKKWPESISTPATIHFVRRLFSSMARPVLSATQRLAKGKVLSERLQPIAISLQRAAGSSSVAVAVAVAIAVKIYQI